jgi:hypothetical protein
MKYIFRKLTFQGVLDGLDEFTAPAIKQAKSIKDLNKWAVAKGLTFKKNQTIFGGYYIDPTTADTYIPDIKWT